MKTDGRELVCPVVFEGMVNGGLTKRELFASAAMQGMLAGNSIQESIETVHQQSGVDFEKLLANCAVAVADALIEALNMPTPTKGAE